jgi:hypothetical protein
MLQTCYQNKNKLVQNQINHYPSNTEKFEREEAITVELIKRLSHFSQNL